MSAVFDIESLKRKSLEFVNLIGNEHDTTSAKIIGLLDKEFAVQHAKLPPSKGGRDAFLTKLGERLKLAQGHVSLEVKHVISESCEQGPNYAQCWIYSRKRTPFGFTNSVDMMTFNKEGRINFCQDLHGPKQGTYSSLFQWLAGFIFG